MRGTAYKTDSVTPGSIHTNVTPDSRDHQETLLLSKTIENSQINKKKLKKKTHL
jgi:hypothetical protein